MSGSDEGLLNIPWGPVTHDFTAHVLHGHLLPNPHNCIHAKVSDMHRYAWADHVWIKWTLIS